MSFFATKHNNFHVGQSERHDSKITNHTYRDWLFWTHQFLTWETNLNGNKKRWYTHLEEQKALRPWICRKFVQKTVAINVQSRNIERDENRCTKRIRFVRHGQGERVTGDRHQIDPAVLGFSEPILQEFGYEGAGANDPLEDKFEGCVWVQNTLIAQMAPLVSITFIAYIHLEIRRLVTKHLIVAILVQRRHKLELVGILS